MVSGVWKFTNKSWEPMQGAGWDMLLQFHEQLNQDGRTS